jgi:hypothetical protein
MPKIYLAHWGVARHIVYEVLRYFVLLVFLMLSLELAKPPDKIYSCLPLYLCRLIIVSLGLHLQGDSCSIDCGAISASYLGRTFELNAVVLLHIKK